MEEKTFLSPTIKTVLFFTIILLTGILLVAVGNPFKKVLAPTLSITPRIYKIEVSADLKSVLNAETKEVIFTIEDANKYLKDFGYAYNPDTFQNSNAKYAGDCFVDAKLSNNKDRIVFSSGCMAGDLPQAWIGVYNINWGSDPNTNCVNKNCLGIPKFRFLIGGGRNFVWSADDKIITYEADLGLSGLTETRTIDAQTGEILKK